MDISYNELRNKEIINLCDGSRLGHIIDMVFCSESGKILGVVAPGEKRIFRKSTDLFIPIEKVRRIGDDVILIRFDLSQTQIRYNQKDMVSKIVSNKSYKISSKENKASFIRYRKLDNKKYK